MADAKVDDNVSVDSGFASGNSSTSSLPLVSFTPAHLRFLNEQLETMHPMDVLRFCRLLFPNLYQMRQRTRLFLVAISFAFSMQKVIFAASISPFLYFQF